MVHGVCIMSQLMKGGPKPAHGLRLNQEKKMQVSRQAHRQHSLPVRHIVCLVRVLLGFYVNLEMERQQERREQESVCVWVYCAHIHTRRDVPTLSEL